jgi:hypothetical protein
MPLTGGTLSRILFPPQEWRHGRIDGALWIGLNITGFNFLENRANVSGDSNCFAMSLG